MRYMMSTSNRSYWFRCDYLSVLRIHIGCLFIHEVDTRMQLLFPERMDPVVIAHFIILEFGEQSGNFGMTKQYFFNYQRRQVFAVLT